MNQLLEFDVAAAEGAKVLVEVAESREVTSEWRGGLRPAEFSLEDSLSVLRPIGEAVARQVGSLAQKPAEVSTTFGLKFSTEWKVPFVTKVAGEGSIQVTMKWTFPK